MTPPDSAPEEGTADAIDRFDQLGEQPMSDQEPDAQQAAAAALGGLPVRGPGMAIMEQRLRATRLQLLDVYRPEKV